MGIRKAIRVFDSPYNVFGNLSVLSIYSEVLAQAMGVMTKIMMETSAVGSSLVLAMKEKGRKKKKQVCIVSIEREVSSLLSQ